MFQLLASQSPITSPLNPVLAPVQRAGSAIQFEAVRFHYPSRPDQPALSDFSLEVEPGQTVALVGPSGAGKSTVFQLLLRFYDPAAGRITLNGVATNALALHVDAESERIVQAALERAMQGRTTLVIAHRLATVIKADHIVVLDHGRLVEQGTHTQLVARGGVYAGLAALQFNV